MSSIVILRQSGLPALELASRKAYDMAFYVIGSISGHVLGFEVQCGA